MTYAEYRKEEQEKADKLPLFFAFTNQQFKEQMEKRGLTENDTDKIYRLGDTGGFYLKSDAEIIRAHFSNKRLDDLMKDEAFAVEAFEYEMDNHEYAINYYQGDYDVLSCFIKCDWDDDKDYTDYLTEAGKPEMIPWYKTARARHMKRAEAWF